MAGDVQAAFKFVRARPSSRRERVERRPPDSAKVRAIMMEISPLRERLTKLESRLEILRGHL
jgi:hypothetical protein